MLVLFCAALSFTACNDELADLPTTGTPTNAIQFQVSTGVHSAQTRAAEDTTDLLQPQVVHAEGLDFPLYLHRYVADESERATGPNVQTRAALINDEAAFYTQNKDEGFMVKSLYSGNEKDIFFDLTNTTPLQQDDDNIWLWNVNPARYWLESDPLLRFYAYAPKQVGTLAENLKMENGKISFSYTVPIDETNKENLDARCDAELQPDIMFAKTDCDRYGAEETIAGDAVPLNFRHALSAIKFAVRDIAAGTIKRITIEGVYGSGTCVFDESVAASNTGDSNQAAAAFKWSNYPEEVTDFSEAFNIKIGDNYVEYPDTDSDKDVVLNNTMPEKTFLMIPQTIPTDAELVITYHRDEDNKDFTFRGKINDGKITEWLPGHEYIYTISTSASNWIYVFDVKGSAQAELTEADEEAGKGPADMPFSEDENNIIVNQTVTEGASYQVQSYRYKANNPSVKQEVPWIIEDTVFGEIDITNISSIIPDGYILDSEKKLKNTAWIPEFPYESVGEGSIDYRKYDVTFASQLSVTDYKGDWDLRSRAQIATDKTHVDLSMVTGIRNTANCYVVNSSGYFKFPTVYGNAITNGVELESSYKNQGSTASKSGHVELETFVDYQGNDITGAKINGAADAVLVWQDAYNLISDIELVEGGDYDYVTFKVNQSAIQQGNAVIAIRDASQRIMWSWHIWVNDHWTQWPDGDDYRGDGKIIDASEANSFLKLGEGDVDCDASEIDNYTFTIAPKSLGWCDEKNVWYVKREGPIKFAQVTPEDNDVKTGLTDQLQALQREKQIVYWIGNNTYYQFGRKDPFVGFRGTNSVVKYNFGEYPYVVPTAAQFKIHTLAESIQEPNILYVGGNDNQGGSNWVGTNYYNLWNNTNIALPGKHPDVMSIEKYHYSGVKTVYDPCPAGYQVPPVAFFRIFTWQLFDDKVMTHDDINQQAYYFNGSIEYRDHGNVNISKNDPVGKPVNYYIWHAKNKKVYNSIVDEKTIDFTYTGHRWFTYELGNIVLPAGYNYNPQIVYLWSNQVMFIDQTRKISYCLALGNDAITDDGEVFALTYRFLGRRSMARPVRPIKLFNDRATNFVVRQPSTSP